MRLLAPALFAAALVSGQSATNIVNIDINGKAQTVSSISASDGSRTELRTSINGTVVPVDQVEEKVLQESPGSKTTEKVTRRFDPNGKPISTERIVTELQTQAGGGSTLHATTYRTDINGRMQEAERKVAVTEVQGQTAQGQTTTTQTTIDQAGLNGSFQTVEKRSAVSTKSDSQTNTSESTYRRDTNGNFTEAQRVVSEQTRSGNRTVENKTQYEPGVTGRMELAEQRVSTAVKSADGGDQTVVDIYGPSSAGYARTQDSALRIQEQLTVSKQVRSDGSVVETVSARQPTDSDPGRLGPPTAISQSVCTGKCLPDKP